MTYGIWCEVWGGVTGRRSSWAKYGGKLLTFASRLEADVAAHKMRVQTMGNPYRTASFAYTVRPLPDERVKS